MHFFPQNILLQTLGKEFFVDKLLEVTSKKKEEIKYKAIKFPDS